MWHLFGDICSFIEKNSWSNISVDILDDETVASEIVVEEIPQLFSYYSDVAAEYLIMLT